MIFMSDTHIHIHLNGAEIESATSPPPKRKARKTSAPPQKAKRKVSAYHKTVGKEMKKLKKAGFRGNVMKKAHAIAKKKHRSRK